MAPVQFYRSADAGASWTSVSSVTSNFVPDYAFGNGKWITVEGDYNVNRVWQSLDDANSWQSVSISSGMSYVNGITWNEYDSQFVIVGGNWVGDGTIAARVQTSPDGTTWTARETGSTQVALNNIKGDNAGNYIATGWTYSAAMVRLLYICTAQTMQQHGLLEHCLLRVIFRTSSLANSRGAILN